MERTRVFDDVTELLTIGTWKLLCVLDLLDNVIPHCLSYLSK